MICPVRGGRAPTDVDPCGLEIEETTNPLEDNPKIRKQFIRAVYFVLTIQLLITMGIIFAIISFEYLQDLLEMVPEITLTSACAFSGIMIIMSFFRNFRRKSPTNYQCLLILTVFAGIFLGALSYRFDTMTILMAVGITAAVCFALSVFAFLPYLDFTMMNGFLVAATIVFMAFGTLFLFFQSPFWSSVYCAVAALLFSAYLVFDTQSLLGGEHGYALETDEYVFAAMNLYVDVVLIFALMLNIFDD